MTPGDALTSLRAALGIAPELRRVRGERIARKLDALAKEQRRVADRTAFAQLARLVQEAAR